MTDRQALEDKIEKADEDQAKAQAEIQQMIGEEQLRTSPDPSHEKIRDEKDLPTPDPDKLPPEDGGHETDPDKVVDNKEEFDKANLVKPVLLEKDTEPTKPATLGDTSKRK